ncbi:MAG: protein translocase subunit SecF [Patescibacteria group bacterium]
MPKFYTIFFGISVFLTVAAFISLFSYGLNFGVDFKGGSVMELSFAKNPPSISEVNKILNDLPATKDAVASLAGTNGIIIRSGELTEADHQIALGVLKKIFDNSNISELSFNSVGPVIGQELKSKSIWAIVYVLLAILIYLGFVFRKLSGTFSLRVMSIGTFAALTHDVILPLGLFAWLGHAYGVEISGVFVAAILTVMGYAISDRVIILDRIRENLLRYRIKDESFGQLVHRSVMQTLGRSINTAVTVLLSLVAIYLFGGESIKYFALALIVGIAAGAYSSIFVASPLLVWLSERT